MRCRQLSVVAVLFLAAAANAVTKDIKAVFADGKITDGKYENGYFGITLTLVQGRFTKGGFVSPEGQRARLIDAQSGAVNWRDRYEIAILADALSKNPLVTSPQLYVRSVRHQLEKEGFETVQSESAVEISGLKFVYATMMKTVGAGQIRYRGLYTTLLNGYIVSLDVSVGDLARLEDILKMVKFEPPRR